MEAPKYREFQGGMLVTFNRSAKSAEGPTEQDTQKTEQEGLKTHQESSENGSMSPQPTPQLTPQPTPQVERTLYCIGGNQFSVKDIMKNLSLTDRKHFINIYLNPSIKQGLIAMLYSDNPHHPDQKYYLTEAGLKLLEQISQNQPNNK